MRAGLHHTRCQSKHVHLHCLTNCMAAGMDPSCDSGQLTVLCRSQPWQFSECEVFFSPTCGRFNQEAMFAWSLGCRYCKRALLPGARWLPSRSKTSSSFVASWLLAGSANPALLVLQPGPIPPPGPTMGAPPDHSLHPQSNRFDLSAAAEMPPLVSASSFPQSKQHFVDSDRWSLAVWTPCLADPSLT